VKGACLITVEDNIVVDLVSVPCDVVRWGTLSVPLNDTSNMGEVTDCIQNALESAVAEEADGRLLACRIKLEGNTEVHAQLVASQEQIVAEARASALGLGDEVAWIEKVVIATEALVDPQTLAQREDAIGELQQMLQDAGSDEELLKLIEDDIGEFVRRLPHEVRADNEDQILKSAVEGDYAALISDVEPYLSARLTAQEN
jgi:hypothetical protein